MNRKLSIIFILFIFSLQLCVASETSSKAANSISTPVTTNANTKTEIPVITNEAEYAEWVRKRDKTYQSSSTKTVSSAASSSALKMASSAAQKQ
jgi:hypothetical protein